MKNKAIDEYIDGQPEDWRSQLREIRDLIHSVVPQAEEMISYQVPSYKYYGMLVGFGVTKNGCSFYSMNADILNNYEKELKGIKYNASTIHFDPEEPLPAALLKKIICHRMKENEELVFLKTQKNYEKA